MKTHKLYFVLPLLVVMMGTLGACTTPEVEGLLTKVTDQKDFESQIWDLEYDDSGRLVKYGDTPISYKWGKIKFGEMEWKSRGFKMYQAEFRPKWGGDYECESLCRLVLGKDSVDARKLTTFKDTQDTLFIRSDYYVDGIEKPVHKVNAKYVYDEENRMTEILSVYSDGDGKETGACHCYYGYNTNISHESNVSMRAFFVDIEGLDTFFYLLLNLGDRESYRYLPNLIRHCVNRGQDGYEADGRYRMKGYLLDRAEVFSFEEKLKLRYEFVHQKLD